MNAEQMQYIAAVLCNDEASSNQELIALFQQELGITGDHARQIVSQRATALADPIAFSISAMSAATKETRRQTLTPPQEIAIHEALAIIDKWAPLAKHIKELETSKDPLRVLIHEIADALLKHA